MERQLPATTSSRRDMDALPYVMYVDPGGIPRGVALETLFFSRI
jgi:hypothetical protein